MTTFLIVAAVSGLAFGVMAIIQAVALQKQVEELMEERDVAELEAAIALEAAGMWMKCSDLWRARFESALPTPKGGAA